MPPALPTGPGSDYSQLSRTVKRTGLLRRRPVYYSLKISLNLVLLAAGWTAFAVLGHGLIGRIHGNLLIGLSYGTSTPPARSPARNRLLTQPPPTRGRP